MLLRSQLQRVKCKPTYHLGLTHNFSLSLLTTGGLVSLLQNSKQSLIIPKDCTVLMAIWSQMAEESILPHEICWPLTHLNKTWGQNEKGKNSFETLLSANLDNYFLCSSCIEI